MIGFSQLGYDGFLGNQLFQYAMLKGVAAKTNFIPQIPKRYKFIPEQTAHNQMGWVQLEPFNIECETAQHKLEHVFNEKQFNFDADVFKIKDNTDFSGYFQSQKYFEHIEPQIRKEFTFCKEIDTKASTFIENLKRKQTLLSMKSPQLVSLHVRRGTYLDYPHTITHNVVGKDYYTNAMAVFKDAVFVVFSDDLDWCRNEFSSNKFYICDTRQLVEPLGNQGPHQHGTHWLDMAIMAKCDHHIIAASTYSWWGAWLNPSPNKKVVAPNNWFGPRFKHLNTQDLLPDDWIKL